MISTRHRIEYTKGFLALGMFDEALAELESVEGSDRLSSEFIILRRDVIALKRLKADAVHFSSKARPFSDHADAHSSTLIST